MYPNPTKKGQSISITSKEYDIDGIMVYSSIGVEIPIKLNKIDNQHFECNMSSNLNSGLYLVKIIVNEEVIFKRLIVE